ncbi:hypothetical protein ES703_02147 [subsurface metagenome]
MTYENLRARIEIRKILKRMGVSDKAIENVFKVYQ